MRLPLGVQGHPNSVGLSPLEVTLVCRATAMTGPTSRPGFLSAIFGMNLAIAGGTIIGLRGLPVLRLPALSGPGTGIDPATGPRNDLIAVSEDDLVLRDPHARHTRGTVATAAPARDHVGFMKEKLIFQCLAGLSVMFQKYRF